MTSAGRRIGAVCAVAASFVACAALAALWLTTAPPAPPADLAAVRARFESSEGVLLDRRGALLHERRVDFRGRRLAWVPLDAIAPALRERVVASEDRRFRSHRGVDVRALGGALRGALRGGPRRGASTLTMQLATLLDPSLRAAPSLRGVLAKLRQMRAALALETRLTKDEILEAYLNLASFRGELQGVDAAARGLLGRAPHALGPSEAAFLAALLPAPNAPPAAVAARACRVSRALARTNGGPSADEYRLADAHAGDVSCEALATLAQRALSAPPRVQPAASLAPHLAAQLLPPLSASEREARAGEAAARAGGPQARAGDAAARAGQTQARAGETASRAGQTQARAGETASRAGQTQARAGETARAGRSQAHAGAAPSRRIATTLDARLQDYVARVLRRQVIELRGRNARDAAALVADNATGEILAWVGGTGDLASAAHVDGVRARRQAGSTLKPFLYARAFDRRLVTPATRLDDSPLDLATPTGSYRPSNYDQSFRGPVPAREALAASLNVPAVRLLELVGTADFVRSLRALGISGLRHPDFYGGSLALGSADVSLLELVGAYRALANGGTYTPLRVVRRAAPTAAEPGASARVFSPAAAFLVADVLADRTSRASGFGLESPLGARVWSAAKTGTSKDMRDNWCLGFTSRYTVGVWLGNFSGEAMWDVSGVDGAAPAWLAIVHALHDAEPSRAPEPPAGLVRAGGEWYLAGSEPSAFAALAATPRAAADARIVAPSDGLVVALDPDIPADRERLLIEAAPRDASLALHLDGRPLGAARAPLLWAPARGRHTLALVGPEGDVLDRVRFEVR